MPWGALVKKSFFFLPHLLGPHISDAISYDKFTVKLSKRIIRMGNFV
jgi:hypothetical protein